MNFRTLHSSTESPSRLCSSIHSRLISQGWKDDPSEISDLMITDTKDLDFLHQVLKSCINTSRVLIYLSTSKLYKAKEIKFEDKNRFLADYTDEKAEPTDEVFTNKDLVKVMACDALVAEYSKSNHIQSCVFRLGCVVGYPLSTNPDGFLSKMIASFKKEEEIIVWGYDGKQVRDQLHIWDVAEAIKVFHTKAQVQRLEGEIYNIGGGQENSLSCLELLKYLFPYAFIYKNSLISGENKPAVIFDYEKKDERPFYVTDYSKFNALTNWKPKVILDNIIGVYLKEGVQ